ncbi:hypothetical protein LTR56_027068 [Elasticomyces elasticus]|nr:hypothetical protein LTR22_027777 [Elasticomyces elasticus]KAK3614712.1 hypothetical protein LTR56_027068 [Elasticomyces elasticus]KAK4904893.1 hypothetical protein LTR49_025743 [Elasticomyces elasticus]KAK5731668.1 hypothetical protein LTS12_027231 [Elasticomyces elasticus]
MDGDSSARTMDKGASAAARSTDLTEGIHEDAKLAPPAGEKTTGTAGSVFDAATGSIGKAFTTQGAIGGTAQKIGGPFDQSGMIGKQFTTEGSIGASAQNILAGSEKTSVQEK